MPEVDIQHARLIELKDDLSDVMPNGRTVEVQFNPESLKLSYANQIQAQPNGSSNSRPPTGNQSQGTAARQFVGAGTTKLAVQLWFDVSAATASPFMVDDVRRVTAKVLYFMKPKPPAAGARDAAQRTPPGVRFSWGSFLFDGIVESVEENVDFFSNTGKALRASLTLNLIQQDILVPDFSARGDGRVPGTRPLWPASSGQSLQQMNDAQPGGSARPGASGNGGAGFAAGGAAFQSGGWQQVALANGIENPRTLAPGQLIDLAAIKPRIVTG
ncbi:peptidoglycan-binding protein [Accumulibacter sp.]|uniref:CIS tube protein n=1 Tax=Accumulibacter sp. TaxID=2053492 RepID=UPI0025D2B670|nr:peptidoglycan-binding protein [Accumulibacter sp.]MCM8593854.1 peptidoglycan-binding protein [Accumulibacter sp.]MCM8626104.1 peptidoglycan-binding protein [Accumulibacter sp.]MDS4047995.1 peptidoglycan-binding protein [Accumulibacter sp.]